MPFLEINATKISVGELDTTDYFSSPGYELKNQFPLKMFIWDCYSVKVQRFFEGERFFLNYCIVNVFYLLFNLAKLPNRKLSIVRNIFSNKCVFNKQKM